MSELFKFFGIFRKEEVVIKTPLHAFLPCRAPTNFSDEPPYPTAQDILLDLLPAI
jgi:hypothetical protein